MIHDSCKLSRNFWRLQKAQVRMIFPGMESVSLTSFYYVTQLLPIFQHALDWLNSKLTLSYILHATTFVRRPCVGMALKCMMRELREVNKKSAPVLRILKVFFERILRM